MREDGAEAEFERIVAEVFRKAGWRIRRHPAAGDMRASFLANDGERKYAVVVKSGSEGRRDRLIPLLSQAILEAQAFVRRLPERAAPLAVVAAPRAPAAVAAEIRKFAERHVPRIAVGVVDAEGYRWFAGPGLRCLEARAPRRADRKVAQPGNAPDPFSDLNQWMLKILLGQDLPEALLAAPRGLVRNASHLAAVARVSVMSASRLVKQLARDGYLDEDEDHLRIVRADELLERWVSANRAMPPDVPARSILKRDQKQLFASVARYAAGIESARQPRCCVGLFAAADALGLGFVRGVAPHLYVERLDLDVLRELGLSLEDADRRSDVVLRVRSKGEAIFRAAVLRDGLPVSDVLQVWLDVSSYPARGREQADEIRRRVLRPLFGKRR
jgi:Holliday junction resolvase